jgi:LDH2 family malate/lactate/ureidoglycolate dehydrogenase
VPKLDHIELLRFCQRLLCAGGVPRDDAVLVAGLLVKAELRGYAGHGVTRVPQYLSFIKNRTYDLSARPQIEREGKVTAIIDGKHYIGQVTAHMAMTLAISKAKEHGVGVVCLRRAGHTGRLADYMEMATEQDMIGMGAVSVGSATTTLYGGMKPITGTNPMAFGIPTRSGRPIVLDFATASMSMGEIQKRVARNEAIPDGVILDGPGKPTNDFKSFRGPPRPILPFGGYKGSASRWSPKSSAACSQATAPANSGGTKAATASAEFSPRRFASTNSSRSRSSITRSTSSSPLPSPPSALPASVRFSCPANPVDAEKRRRGRPGGNHPRHMV